MQHVNAIRRVAFGRLLCTRHGMRLSFAHNVRPVPKRVQRRALATGRPPDTKDFLLREAKILAALAVVGALGGTAYYYKRRHNLPSRVYAGIAAAEAYMEKGNYTEALVELEETKQVVQNGEFSAESSEYVLFLLGQCYNHLGQYELAKLTFLRSIALLSKEPKESASMKRKRVLMAAHNGLGLAMHKLGRSQEAEAWYFKALALGSSPQQIGELVEEVSKVLPLSSLVDSSEEVEVDPLVRRLAAEEKFESLCEFAVEIAGTLNNLGAMYAESGRVQSAEEVYLRCLVFLVVFGMNGSTFAEQCREVVRAIRLPQLDDEQGDL